MKILKKREAAERLGIHPESLMRLVRQGRFKRPITIVEGGRDKGWPDYEIEAYQKARIAARDEEPEVATT